MPRGTTINVVHFYEMVGRFGHGREQIARAINMKNFVSQAII